MHSEKQRPQSSDRRRRVAPMLMQESAMLKTGQCQVPAKMSIKSITWPWTKRSIRLPTAPAITRENALRISGESEP